MVLSVPLSGHEGKENPGRYFESRFVRAIRTDTLETLEFVFHVEFKPGFGSPIQVSNLWDDEKLIRFSRTAAAKANSNLMRKTPRRPKRSSTTSLLQMKECHSVEYFS